jgi:adenylate kinase family enzyme
MEKYDKLMVNNLTFETLNPENIIAKLYTSNFDEEYKNNIIVMINNSILQEDHRLYQNIINRIVNDKSLSTRFDKPEYKELDKDCSKQFETTHDYAGKSYTTVKNNLGNNINLQSKLKKYIKIYKNKNSTDEIIKNKKLLNNIKKKI